MTEILGEPSTEATCEVGALLLKRCTTCGDLRAPVVAQCGTCRSDLFDEVPASGLGAIVSSRAVVRAPGDEDWREVPHNIAIVATDEGPWLYSHIEGVLPKSSDRRVRVTYVAPAGNSRLPVFTVRD
ncbi:Zn-ribbon domain-containing OB-fold protein [Rhodococcus gannanensis]|uniref:Zn-ribbon domain-containing OB-fold protein n=1 Tax=Rhodococcus gannanensis TaxID=1960308 RepID=A0ABW4NYQ7_9NOCA